MNKMLNFKLYTMKVIPSEVHTLYAYFSIEGDKNEYVIFGIQEHIIKELQKRWNENFFGVPFNDILIPDEIKDEMQRLHSIGVLPVSIKCVEEGNILPNKVPFMTMENTVPEFSWVVPLVMRSMKGVENIIYTATVVKDYADVLKKWNVKNGNEDFAQYQAFLEPSNVSNTAAFLTSFSKTTDLFNYSTIEKNYRAKDLLLTGINIISNDIVSINVGNYIRKHNLSYEDVSKAEFETIKNLLNLHTSGTLIIPIDTYDTLNFIFCHLPNLEKELKGDRHVMLSVDALGNIDSIVDLIVNLGDIVGTKKNEKGHYVLANDLKVFVKSLSAEQVDKLLSELNELKVSCTNLLFEISISKGNIKLCSSVSHIESSIKGRNEQIEVFKDGEKRTKRGLIQVIRNASNVIEAIAQVNKDAEGRGLIMSIFRNSIIEYNTSLRMVREKLSGKKEEKKVVPEAPRGFIRDMGLDLPRHRAIDFAPLPEMDAHPAPPEEAEGNEAQIEEVL